MRAVSAGLLLLLAIALAAPAAVFADNGNNQNGNGCPPPCEDGLVILDVAPGENTYPVPSHTGKTIWVQVADGDGVRVDFDSEVPVMRVVLYAEGQEVPCSVYDYSETGGATEGTGLHAPGWGMPDRIEFCFTDEGKDEGAPTPDIEEETPPTVETTPAPKPVLLPRTGGDGMALLGYAALFGSGGVAARTLARRRED